jgi:hypothetical protein
MDPFVLALIAGVVGGLVTAVGITLKAYASEKGKNYATKQDVATIESQIEAIRTSGQAHQLINRTQYELELAAYRDVWESLLPVHTTVRALRASFLPITVGPEAEQQAKAARHDALVSAYNAFSLAVWRHRPFYPQVVFDDLIELLRLVHVEAIEHRVFDPDKQEDYWERAEANVKLIDAQVEKVCETIRDRLSAARVA